MLPLWFLVLALFLPRLSVALLWLYSHLPHLPIPNWLELVSWVILVRFLVAFMIYVTMGPNLWFWIHATVAVVVALGTGASRFRD